MSSPLWVRVPLTSLAGSASLPVWAPLVRSSEPVMSPSAAEEPPLSAASWLSSDTSRSTSTLSPTSSSTGVRITSMPGWVFWVVAPKSSVKSTMPSLRRTLLMPPVTWKVVSWKVAVTVRSGLPMKAVPSPRKPTA